MESALLCATVAAMGQSKRYKGKTCAYCREPGSSSTNDHVIGRCFFLKEDQSGLPQVPACQPCNHEKSKLEQYIATSLVIGSQHPEANRYRAEMVKPRLDKNDRLRRELRIDAPPEWVRVNGVFRQMHAVKIDAKKADELASLISLGLYRHHTGTTLDPDFIPDARMLHPDAEPAIWASVADFFPDTSPHFAGDLGRGSFAYAGKVSPANAGFSVWQIAWHGGIALHGENTPPDGVVRWWIFTRPGPEAVRRASTSAPS